MLTISPFLVIDDNTNINNNERARKINRKLKQTCKRKRDKELKSQTKSIDMSQITAYARVKCTYP